MHGNRLVNFLEALRCFLVTRVRGQGDVGPFVGEISTMPDGVAALGFKV